MNKVEIIPTARKLYIMCYEENYDANLVVDGCLPVEDQVAQILSAIRMQL